MRKLRNRVHNIRRRSPSDLFRTSVVNTLGPSKNPSGEEFMKVMAPPFRKFIISTSRLLKFSDKNETTAHCDVTKKLSNPLSHVARYVGADGGSARLAHGHPVQCLAWGCKGAQYGPVAGPLGPAPTPFGCHSRVLSPKQW